VVFLEGTRLVRQAAASGAAIELLAVREGTDFDVPAERKVVLAPRLFDTLALTETPQGVLAIGRADLEPIGEAIRAAREAGWPLVVLDGIQDPGNVGAIARTAAAAGAPALAFLPGTADPYGPKALRGSAGNVLKLSVARATWSDLEGLRLLGADAGGEAYMDTDLDVDALVLGSEAHGLSRPMAAVAVPMANGVESLNVGAAAAVLLFEIARRKRG
jgi:TrmH family RNA methyltransferase